MGYNTVELDTVNCLPADRGRCQTGPEADEKLRKNFTIPDFPDRMIAEGKRRESGKEI